MTPSHAATTPLASKLLGPESEFFAAIVVQAMLTAAGNEAGEVKVAVKVG